MPTRGRAPRIFDLETKIARAHVDAVAAQDPHRCRPGAGPNRHPRPRSDGTHLTAAQLSGQDEIVPGMQAGPRPEPGRSEPLDAWKMDGLHNANRFPPVRPRL